MIDYFSLISRAAAEGETQQSQQTTGTTQTTTNPNDPNTQQGSLGASLVGMLLPLVLMGVIFYFMLIRPQRKKDKKVKEMLDNLKSGDRVTTIGGIYGTIVSIKDDTITLAVGQKNAQPYEMTVARWAIRNVEEISVENEGEMLN